MLFVKKIVFQWLAIWENCFSCRNMSTKRPIRFGSPKTVLDFLGGKKTLRGKTMFGKTILGKTICGPTHRLFGQLFSRMPCNEHWLFVRCTWFVKSAAQTIYKSSCSKLLSFSFFAFALIHLLYCSSSAASLIVLPLYFPAVMINHGLIQPED